MIVWATEFPVPHGTDPEAILALCRKWLNGSPHLPFAGTTFPTVSDGAIGTNGWHPDLRPLLTQ